MINIHVMKNKFKYIAAAFVASASLVSCADLDTEVQGGYVNAEQKESVLEMNPDMAVAGVTGINAQMTKYNAVYAAHFDFGYPTLMLGTDLQTADMNCKQSGYNWFQYWQGYTAPNDIGTPGTFAWRSMYKLIKIENDLAATLPADTEDETLMYFRAQALAGRSFAYWTLANLFQFNYKWHKDDLCVSIITDENSDEAALNGAPRATVAEVFEQIMKDINEAITLLEKTSVTGEAVIVDKAKRLITKATAYGLRARYNLTMGKYAEAAADAQKAISEFPGAPYSMAEAGRPAFYSMADNSWMWGIAIGEQDDVVLTGIINFPSQICSFCGNGYISAGAWKACAEDLYKSIPSTDVRKGWFLDANFTSKNLTSTEVSYLSKYKYNGKFNYGSDDTPTLYPYTNVKYGAYQGVVGQTTNASDIPLMRVEEMYLIKAEGQAMSGDLPGGKATLEDFVKTYRNPSYSSSATSAEEFQEEVFQQRRIELWGEGLIYYDYMRLNKGINRLNSGCPDAFRYNIPAGDPVLIYCIPDDEYSANKGMAGQPNNETSSRPVAIPR